MSDSGFVPVKRWWLEHVLKSLKGELPSGHIGDTVYLLRDQIAAILATPSPSPVVDGWQLVPKDLTNDMLVAAYEALGKLIEAGDLELKAIPGSLPSSLWDTLLASAPQSVPAGTRDDGIEAAAKDSGTISGSEGRSSSPSTRTNEQVLDDATEHTRHWKFIEGENSLLGEYCWKQKDAGREEIPMGELLYVVSGIRLALAASAPSPSAGGDLHCSSADSQSIPAGRDEETTKALWALEELAKANWRSVEKDNMEFEVRTTCFVRDAILPFASKSTPSLQGGLTCTSCGSTKSIEEIRAGGHLSCCPERNMKPAPAVSGEGWSVRDFMRESLRIEGIHREPTQDELDTTEEFLRLESPGVEAVKHLVSVYQPDAVIRDKPTLNVRVGDHIAPRGGTEIVNALASILSRLGTDDPWKMHIEYETLHPFTDGNGRSGRALWLWQMRRAPIGFLHMFYYQTLSASRHFPSPEGRGRE